MPETPALKRLVALVNIPSELTQDKPDGSRIERGSEFETDAERAKSLVAAKYAKAA